MSSSELADTQPAGPDDRPLATATIGRFAVSGRLGQGGMGTVLLATDPLLGRQVAIKVLRGEGNDTGQRRLLREAQAMARVSHENVIVVHEVGMHGARVYVAMELVTGGTLRTWRAGRGWREIVEHYVRAGRGLAAAHAAGLVHRDFKPDNVLVGDDGRVRVTDFGLVSAEGEVARRDAATGDVSLTQTGAVMGTPRYMAPEQHLGESVDARADQFAFCVALYEALYEKLPFAGDTMVALGERVIAGEVEAVPADSAVPAAVRDAVLRGLRRDRAARFPSMGELLDVLAASAARVRRRWWPSLVAGIAALALGIAIAIYLVVAARGGEGPVAGPAHGVRIAYTLAEGGARALDRTAEIVRARIARRGVTSYRVAVSGALLVVELPAMDAESLAETQNTIARTARLEIQLADSATEVLRPIAPDPAFAIQTDNWQAGGGDPQTDTYLRAADRATLERAIGGLAVPADHRFVYERSVDLATWRTFYVARASPLTSASVTSAKARRDPQTGGTSITLTFDDAGTRILGDLTAANVGKKLAFLLEGRVESAGVINGAIRGGVLALTRPRQDGVDPEIALRDAEDLAIALESGALPARLVEDHIDRF